MDHLSFGERVALTWSLFWRASVVGVLSMIVSGLIGFGVGYALAAAGFSLATVQVAGVIIGLANGLGSWFVYVWWILSARLGKYRLEVAQVRY